MRCSVRRRSPLMMFSAKISVWNGVRLSMVGSTGTDTSSPDASTWTGRATVTVWSETLSCDSSIVDRRSSISDLRISGLLLVQLVRRRLEQRPELALVDALVVRLVGADPALLEHAHDRVVERHHPELLAGLDGRRDLHGLALADQVADGGGADQDLQRGAAALLVHALEEVLGHDDLETGGKTVAHLGLLLGREHLDDAVDGLGRARGVEGAEHEVTGVGRLQRQADGLQISHFTDEDDVGVFTKGAAQRRRERPRVRADLAMVHQAALALVHELDRVLDGDDVVLAVLVGVVDDRGQRGGLS